MRSQTTSPEAYLEEIPEERKESFHHLRKVILEHLPAGFEETMQYGMISYVVPLSLYPAGYHCDPKQPLPFAAIANQKNSVNLYHMGMYARPALLSWFAEEYRKATGKKPDMGKSCIRFSKPEHIPLELIGDLFGRISVDDWIDLYQAAFLKKNN